MRKVFRRLTLKRTLQMNGFLRDLEKVERINKEGLAICKKGSKKGKVLRKAGGNPLKEGPADALHLSTGWEENEVPVKKRGMIRSFIDRFHKRT